MRYGGNRNVVDFAERYYTGYKLSHITDQLTESIAAYSKAKDLMVTAMRNSLGAGTYTTISPFTDAILPDPQSSQGLCADVEQTLNTYDDIVSGILTKGPYTVEKTNDNNQRVGNWSSIQTYSNNNILALDDVYTECATVASALNSLFLNVKEILSGNSVAKSLPDYFNDDNKEFEYITQIIHLLKQVKIMICLLVLMVYSRMLSITRHSPGITLTL